MTVSVVDTHKRLKLSVADFNVCCVGGRQYFTDDRIGPYNFTSSQADGELDGGGLTNPILQLEFVNHVAEFDVSALSHYYTHDY